MSDNSFTPFIQPINPWLLPAGPFNELIQRVGVKTQWQKSHTCPCTYRGAGPNGYPLFGTADPNCLTCAGRGIYWDAPSAPFNTLITFMKMSPSPDEYGGITDEHLGLGQHGEPTLTITSDAPSPVYDECGFYDAWIESDGQVRLETALRSGRLEVLPYQQNLVIAPTGAVTVYNVNTNLVEMVEGYTVNGATVQLPPGMYPEGTGYVVSFLAAPVWISYRKGGGMPHVRPFGGVNGAVPLPKRFRCQMLDYWLRQRTDTTGDGVGA